ncbi:MAG: hypothetical protein JOY71_26425 [Acetobacteraceae bacterium]|nr:hypothetical protein [Acetobacteraceae bacterium]MBV8525612.1 hypothetical protein [Acetobacteraceae bacterium]MBV8591399.1 hypothetical protein [Acetobacteraceae bacterium]
MERAPSPEWRALAPYVIVLAEAEEGFRMMAHAGAEVALGDHVTASFRRVAVSCCPISRSPARQPAEAHPAPLLAQPNGCG